MRLSRFLYVSVGRQTLMLCLDGLVAAGSLWFATLLRFEGDIPESYLATLPAFALMIASYRVLANMLYRLHRWSFRFSSLADAARIAMAGATGTGLFLATMYLLRDPGPPRSVVVLELLMTTLFMVSFRFSPRLAELYIGDWSRRRKQESLRTLIAGAGAAGEVLLRDLRRSEAHLYDIIGFVDDDPGKLGHVVSGKSVLGGLDQLPELARRYRIEQLLIAIPRLEGRRIREILSQCADLKLRFKILPVSFVYLQEHTASSMMQDLSTDDLLLREPVTFSDEGNATSIRDRVALVTGAAGSIGSEICSQLLQAGLKTLVMVDMNENDMYLAKRRYEQQFPQAEVFAEVADIRDARRVHSLFARYEPQDVFHAAAHKHVPLMETAPAEAVKNNILGTLNVCRAADACGCHRLTYISTDKAVRPTSVMGASKRVGEEIVRMFARRSATRFCAVRFGNVLASAGSVVQIFREQIAAGGPVTVTHPEVRRYFMTISEAVALVLRSSYGDYGELCVLDMGEQIKISTLARHMVTMTGLVPDVDIPLVFTGLRPGEKLHEELLTEEEEKTQRVHDKIFVADCPPPVDELETQIEMLRVAAETEDPSSVVAMLSSVVVSYSPTEQPSEKLRGSESAGASVRSA
jgi:FlaA1/EpsC-like NDP-sugar epimerase